VTGEHTQLAFVHNEQVLVQMYSDKNQRLIPYRLSSLYALAYCINKHRLSPEVFRKKRRNIRMLWKIVDELLEVLDVRKETMSRLLPEDQRNWDLLANHLNACISIVTASSVNGAYRHPLEYYGNEYVTLANFCLFYDTRNQCYHVCTDEAAFLEERSVCEYCGEQLSRRDVRKNM